MKYIVLAFLLMAVACSKPNTTTPTPSNPTGSTYPNRIAVPYWGDDTLVCTDTMYGMQNPKHRIDSFVTFMSGSESKFIHKGITYSIWIDTTLLQPSAFKPGNIFYSVGVGVSQGWHDTDMNSYIIQYYPGFYHSSSMGGNVKQDRSIIFGEPLFNSKALQYTWWGRHK